MDYGLESKVYELELSLAGIVNFIENFESLPSEVAAGFIIAILAVVAIIVAIAFVAWDSFSNGNNNQGGPPWGV